MNIIWNRKQIKALLIFEVIVCYMALLAVISYIRGPQRYELLTDAPLLEAADFMSFAGAPARDMPLILENETQGNAVGYMAELSLVGLERIHVSFQLDCPVQYSGGTLFVDLQNWEKGYDSAEQEYALLLQEGLNEVSVTLEPGESAPERALLRIFTLDPAGYTVDGLQVYQEQMLPKVPPVLLGGLTGCLILLCVLLWKYRYCCMDIAGGKL